MLIQLLIKIINSILTVEKERDRLRSLLQALDLSPNHKVLDVGCGYGKNVILMREMGLNVLGVEVNPAIVAKNCNVGINCVTVEEFNAIQEKYDLMLVSHVIEHFQPDDLLVFLDSYLDRLKVGGFLIIATPLYSPYFYEDFDHVKPCHPTGINMVFCSNDAQVQFYSRNKLTLINIWFRKGPFRRIFGRDIYIPKSFPVSKIINMIFALTFKMSFGIIGRKDGWIGVYKKIS